MPELTPLPEFPDGWFHARKIHDEDGYIMWRRGTGDNVELTHIKSTVPGGGTRLFRKMLVNLLQNPPYGGKGTVFGFTRVGNNAAKSFYRRMGFHLTIVEGVYAEGAAMVFSAPFTKLCNRHGIH